MNNARNTLRHQVVSLFSSLLHDKSRDYFASDNPKGNDLSSSVHWMAGRSDLSISDVEKLSVSFGLQPIFSVALPTESVDITLRSLDASVRYSVGRGVEPDRTLPWLLMNNKVWKNTDRPKWVAVWNSSDE